MPQESPRLDFGGVKLRFQRSVQDSWEDLADLAGVPLHVRAEWTPGQQPRRLWEWLELRDQLDRLPKALVEVHHPELAETVATMLADPAAGGPGSAPQTAARTPPARRLGKPIRSCSALSLEVHTAIDMPDRDATPSVLPRYVARAHDAHLRRLVNECDAGRSAMITLVGGSSTGKTRACWEAVQALSPRWRLWHPIDPSRPAAAANDIASAGSYTVVWLNEAQFYLLGADPSLSERISAGLRTMVDDPDRAPVLVLATMWPEYWATLTARPPPGTPDRHAQARELLSGTDLRLADSFAGADLHAMRAAATTDPRLREAVAHADSGRITQYLSGVPELLQRSRNAPAPAKAIIDCAIDARRFGHPPALSSTLLQSGALGYLHAVDRQRAAEDWVDQGFAYALEPCHGVRGPLSVVDPEPAHPFGPFEPPAYRLADYLEQVGRAERADVFPPASFWDAILDSSRDPDVLRAIGAQAERRGRNRRAVSLYRRSADLGDIEALEALGRLHHQAGDLARAEALYTLAADRGSTEAVENRSWLRELMGRSPDGDEFLAETQDRHMEMALNNDYYERLYAVELAAEDEAEPPTSARHSGATVDPNAAKAEAAAADEALHHETEGRKATADELAFRAADQGDVRILLLLATRREQDGDLGHAEPLFRRAAEHGDTAAMRGLARIAGSRGDHVTAQELLLSVINRGNEGALSDLAALYESMGDHFSAEGVRRFGLDDRGRPAVD
jgi:TPR repeat protein